MDADAGRTMSWIEFGRLAALALLSTAGLVLVVVAEISHDSWAILLRCALAVACWIMAFVVIPWLMRIRGRDAKPTN